MNAELGPGQDLNRHYTRGRRAPITVSKIGSIEAWWGRQDLAVYLAGFPLLFALVATIRLWWPAVHATFGPAGGAVATVAICLGLPFIAGASVAAAGISTRDIPRHLQSALAMLPRPGASGTAGSTTAHGEPSVRLSGVASHTWVIASPPAELDPTSTQE